MKGVRVEGLREEWEMKGWERLERLEGDWGDRDKV